MDPDVALAELRGAATELEAADNAATGLPGDEAALVNAARDMLERFHALDEWLMRGGFLPTDWSQR